MTLWEILKANKTGIAPDMFTMLAASKMNGGRDRLHELSGIPPLSFTAKGKPLTAWSITGNTVQNGTPTPENPVEVQAVGDRTGNLFDGLLIGGHFTSANFDILGNEDVYKSIKVFLPAGTYTFSWGKKVNVVRLIIDGNYSQPVYNDVSSYTITSTTDGYVGISFRDTTSSSTVWDVTTPIMLNEGSTALPYEPYGYKIPVVTSADGTEPITTPIYLPTPLYRGEVMRSDGSREVKLKGTKIKNIQWTYDSELSRFVSKLIHNNIPEAPSRSIIGYSDIYECLHNDEKFDISWSNKFYIGANRKTIQIYIHDTRFNNVNDFVSSVGEYKIYFPVALTTETFTAPQIPTLNGTTVIDVDTAVKPESMTIKYKAV